MVDAKWRNKQSVMSGVRKSLISPAADELIYLGKRLHSPTLQSL